MATTKPELGNIIQTLITPSGLTVDVHDCESSRKIVTVSKNGEYISQEEQPQCCMDVSICPAPDPYILISNHINNDDIIPNSIGGFIMMLKQKHNPDAANSRSMISCGLYEITESCKQLNSMDDVQVSLPDLRVTKPLMYFPHHKYLLWREDIVVCCAVTFACQGCQSGTKFFNSIPVPIGTTSVLFRDGQLHFIGSYGTHTIDYTPQWE